MSAKTVIWTAALIGLGMSARTLADSSESAPPQNGGAFDRMDQNHDGLIQREELEQVARERGDRPRAGRGRGLGATSRADRAEEFEKRVNEAVDRALERSAGDPEKLHQFLREELLRSLPRGRDHARRGNPDTSPDANKADGRDAPPLDGAPGADGESGLRRPPRAELGAVRGRRGRGGGSRNGAIFRNFDPEQRADRVLKRFDANHDGRLTPDELGDRGERLMKADTNGDLHVDASELKAFFQQLQEEGGDHRESRAKDSTPKP